MVTYIIVCSAVIIFMVAVLLVMKTKQMEWENNRMQSYMDSMEELYEAMKDKIEAARKYRHDLAKHIQTLETLLEKYHNSSEIQDYVEYMVDQYQQVKNDIYCTDEFVNAICELKVKQCAERQIPIEVNVADGDYSDVKEFDLVGLLHNLLDNAMEANEKINEIAKRGIVFSMCRKEKQIVIKIRNQVNDIEHLSFVTKKQHREDHGIGMQIIQSLTEKYHGIVTHQVSKEMEWLLVEVVLNVG